MSRGVSHFRKASVCDDVCRPLRGPRVVRGDRDFITAERDLNRAGLDFDDREVTIAADPELRGRRAHQRIAGEHGKRARYRDRHCTSLEERRLLRVLAVDHERGVRVERQVRVADGDRGRCIAGDEARWLV